MCIFHQVIVVPPNYSSLRYVPDIIMLYSKYSKYLCDDFSSYSPLNFFHNSPFIYAVTDINNNFMGFISLDNFIGSDEFNYSAEVTTCFDRKAWGNFTRHSAEFFLKFAFEKFGFTKIKACVFPDNFRVKTLLKSSGFFYETTLRNETLRLGKPQDIDVYAVYRSYYY